MFEIKGKYTNAKIYAEIVENEAISQIQGLCNHPAFENASIRVMPDIHAGAGCTIGTTAILNEKKIIPNVVGVDIFCGVLTTIFKIEDAIDFKALDDYITMNIPSGQNVRENLHSDINSNVKNAVEEIVRELKLGDADRHIKSIGTLGGGNHYIEIGKIDESTLVLTVHSGSRNLGKKVCEYFQEKALENISGKNELREAINELIKKLKSEHREKEISEKIVELTENFSGAKTGIPKDLAYIEGAEYDAYIKNMLKCGLMAGENRRLISKDIIDYLKNAYSNVEVIEQYDTIHNYIEQLNDGRIVIRKGAISAKKEERLTIPLNMKDGVIIGVGKGNNDWNQSAPHGAGRLLSRSAANDTLSMEDFTESMKGINTWSVARETLDEAPGAYKPAESIINQVKDTIDIICIAKPVYNFKAHTPTISWAEKKKYAKENNS